MARENKRGCYARLTDVDDDIGVLCTSCLIRVPLNVWDDESSLVARYVHSICSILDRCGRQMIWAKVRLRRKATTVWKIERCDATKSGGAELLVTQGFSYIMV
ncbi:hypothetical protein Ocin01_07100 [Orchesella cincta]|uniref:Uncharacterized protein n=1 Tax=Orchesella cincta TaxID=48709 RepID=A0A1D2N2W5_ORCCI|nr:hypothetical protein Ocin01_07100 [Orchesella cincta]